jgi:5'-deoxynucleotidase
MLPAELRASYEPLVLEDDKEVEPFVKAADKLSAHIKCLEEQKAGNTEFDTAAKQTWDSMKAMNRPELDWFLENCLGAFALNLDQL